MTLPQASPCHLLEDQHLPHVMLCAQVVETMDVALTPAALEAMPYADAVIREVLRVAPPSASVFRRTLVDLEVNRASGPIWRQTVADLVAIITHRFQCPSIFDQWASERAS